MEDRIALFARGDAVQSASPSELRLLEWISEFHTLDEHARRIARADLFAALKRNKECATGGWLARLGRRASEYVLKHDRTYERAVKSVRPALLALASRGMTISVRDFIFALSARSSAEDNTLSTTVLQLCVPTANRPRSLARCLRGYLTNAELFGHKPRIVVADSSADGDIITANLESLRSIANDFQVEVLYASAPEKEAFAQRTSRELGIPAEVVRFALLDTFGLGDPIGGNRNALLLECAGSALFSVDDDTVCNPGFPPERNTGFALVSEADPIEFWFYADRPAALAALRVAEVDVFGMQTEILGQRIAQKLAFVPNGAVAVSRFCPSALPSLGLASQLWVAAAVPGIIGDSGMFSAAGLLSHSSDSTRNRLVKSEEGYRQALSSTEVLRVADCDTFSYACPLMAGTIGIDATALVPPFLPIKRGEDNLFGITLQKCVPASCVAHLPWALLHDAAPRRMYNADVFSSVAHIRLTNVLMAVMSTCSFDGITNPPERLQHLGVHLRAVGELDASAFELHVFRAQEYLNKLYARQSSEC